MTLLTSALNFSISTFAIQNSTHSPFVFMSLLTAHTHAHTHTHKHTQCTGSHDYGKTPNTTRQTISLKTHTLPEYYIFLHRHCFKRYTVFPSYLAWKEYPSQGWAWVGTCPPKFLQDHCSNATLSHESASN